jgi:hypothetical protein
LQAENNMDIIMKEISIQEPVKILVVSSYADNGEHPETKTEIKLTEKVPQTV